MGQGKRSPNVAVFVDQLYDFELRPGNVVQWKSDENGVTEIRRMSLAQFKKAYARIGTLLALVGMAAPGNIIPFPSIGA